MYQCFFCPCCCSIDEIKRIMYDGKKIYFLNTALYECGCDS